MSIPASRWWHLHWREYLSDQEFTCDPRLWLLVDHIALTTNGKDPAGEGSTVSLATLAEVTGWDRKTVSRKVDDLERRGVLLVKRYDVRTGGMGRPGHRYLLPPFLTSRELKGPAERGMTPNSSETYGSSHAVDDPKPGPTCGSSRPTYGSSGPTYGSSHAHDDPGRVLKGLEGGDARAGAREDTPPPPAFIDQCSRHQDDYNDTPCRGCMRQREHNEAAAEDDRELTRQEVADILGPDYQQAPTPPDELLDDPAACVAWQRKWRAERDAERLKKANAMRRPRGGDSAKVKDLAQRIIDRRVRHNDNTPWDRIPVPTWNQALAMARNLAPHPWCGRCHEITRIVYEDGRPTACQCHPDRSGVAS